MRSRVCPREATVISHPDLGSLVLIVLSVRSVSSEMCSDRHTICPFSVDVMDLPYGQHE